MEHLIQISIAMDDKSIAKQVEDSLVTKIHKDIYEKYFENDWKSDRRIEHICHEEVKEFIAENKDEIINRAVEQIKRSVLKTNSFNKQLEEIENG